MFGRRKSSGVVADAAGTVAEYGGQVIEDEKVRKRTLAAVAAALAARERAKRPAGLVGRGRRLAADPVFRAQLAEAVAELQKARRRVERSRSHKLRNALLVLAGFGAVSAAVKVPSVRRRVEALLRRSKEAAGKISGGQAPAAVVEQIEVETPARTT